MNKTIVEKFDSQRLLDKTDNFIVNKLSNNYENHILINSLKSLASTEQKTTSHPLPLYYIVCKIRVIITFRIDSHHLLYIHLKIDSKIF